MYFQKIFALVTLLVLFALPAFASARSALLKELQLRQENHILSPEEYGEQRAALELILQNQDPGKALAALWEKMQAYKSINRSCHGLVHAIGHAAYAKYGSVEKALAFHNDICGSGYLHGIIEMHFTTVADVRAEMLTICKVGAGKCYHGVGHGMMFLTGNNVPGALKLCDNYKNAAARMQCAEGVFMENFNTDRENHQSAYLKEDDPLFPCPQQNSFYKHACYFYAPRYMLQLHPNSYDLALAQCAKAEKAYRYDCYKGVGSAAMKQRIGQPAYVESICMTAPAGAIASCIQGMASYYTVNFASAQKGMEMCRGLKKTNQKACMGGVK